jgi:hypothetical protein
VISRLLVIVLAFAAAVAQVSRGAYVEAAGLVGLGAGLLILRQWGRDPRRRWLAWAAFGITAAAMAVVAMRMR